MSELTPTPGNSWSTARILLAAAMEMDVADIGDDAAIGRLENWDSLAHMRLILALEEHMGAELTPDTVVSLGSLADVVTVLDEGQLPAQI
jgi:acyl carrier protein